MLCRVNAELLVVVTCWIISSVESNEASKRVLLLLAPFWLLNSFDSYPLFPLSGLSMR
jgi:hypothetical protein